MSHRKMTFHIKKVMPYPEWGMYMPNSHKEEYLYLAADFMDTDSAKNIDISPKSVTVLSEVKSSYVIFSLVHSSVAPSFLFSTPNKRLLCGYQKSSEIYYLKISHEKCYKCLIQFHQVIVIILEDQCRERQEQARFKRSEYIVWN